MSTAALIRLISDRQLMGSDANGPWLKLSGWALFGLTSAADLLVG
jgi:hypothetical protein